MDGESMEQGNLTIWVTTEDGATPVPGAAVLVTRQDTGAGTEAVSDENGRTPGISVTAPPAENSRVPNGEPVDAKLTVQVRAGGYAPVRIDGVQVFSGIESILPVALTPADARSRTGTAEIAYDIPETAVAQREEREPEGPGERERILTQVYIPEYITVHLGRPDVAAENERVSFPYYIKNVCCSEVYPTWPENAIRANVHAQVGFALNRVFTEWYTSRGYNFNITNSTAFDQAYVKGRNIFSNVDRIVNDIFNIYPIRQGRQEPLFTSYCNGTTVTCNGLSQWGTVDLARRGYDPLAILRYYYGQNVELVETNDIRGIEASYPGYYLRRGSEGDAVRIIQQQLIRIRQNYPAIPTISRATGYFGSETEAAVRAFQRLFNLQVDGIVGKNTWYQLSYLYTVVKGLASLDSEGIPGGNAVAYPGYYIRQGSRGDYVRVLQQYLNDLSGLYSEIPAISVDGVFGRRTLAAVRAFQRLFNLQVDGIVGPRTWNTLAQVWSNTFQ